MNLPIIFRFLPAESSDTKDPDYTKSGLNPPFHSSAGQRYRQPNINRKKDNRQLANEQILTIDRLSLKCKKITAKTDIMEEQIYDSVR